MSEKHDLARASSNGTYAQPKGKLTLVNSLTILVILYLASGAILILATSRIPTLVTWLELGQWILMILWLIIGVRPPFMAWLKRAKQHKK